MYRIRKPSTNFENIPVSSMEGPSSPTSITFWNRECQLHSAENDCVNRKKNVERVIPTKILSPRTKHNSHKCGPASSHLISVRNSRTVADHSRPTSPPSIRFDSSRTMERQIKDTRKAIAEYMRTSGSMCPSRDKRYKNPSQNSLSSAGLNVRRLASNIQNFAVDLSDNSRDVSTVNTCSDLPPDCCWTALNNEGSKKQTSTKDCTVQTSSCFIKTRAQQPEGDSFYRNVPKKTHKTGNDKSMHSAMRPRTRLQQNPQASRNRIAAQHTISSKRKLKIPDHKIIYMDKLYPNGAQFWAQIASELDKQENQIQGRTKHAQY